MSSVPHLCIDPYLLSLPRMDTSSVEDVEDFVSSIVDWRKTFDGRGSRAFVSSTVLDAIDEDDAFPWREKLLSILKHFKVKSADFDTVSRAIQAFLNCAKIEDSVELKALLLEDKKTNVVPAFVCNRLRPKTRHAFYDLLAMIVMVEHGYGRDVDQIALASIPSDNTEPELQYLSVSTEIVEFEWQSNSDDRDIHQPFAIDDRVSVFFSRIGMLESIEPLSLWPATVDISAAYNAIDCCIARLVAAGTSQELRISYSIGESFLRTAQKWQCGYEGRHAFTLIESCARIVLGIPKHEVKPFYDGASGRQKIRDDGALALRTHITKRGAGLRLMLWELPDKTIEFANVGDKDELQIL